MTSETLNFRFASFKEFVMLLYLNFCYRMMSDCSYEDHGLRKECRGKNLLISIPGFETDTSFDLELII